MTISPRHEHPAPQRSPAGRWSLLATGALIAAATGLAHLPGLRGAFIWDDDVYVTNNPALRDADGLRRIWLEPGGLRTQYYPLTLTTFWIERRLFGDDPLGYHVTNLALHAASAVLFWLTLRRLALTGALLAALIFAVHPMQVESVAWVTERKNVLCGLWVMLTLLGWVTFLERRGRWAYVGAWGAFVAALLSKSAAVPLPAVLILIAWATRPRQELWRSVLAVLPFAAATAAMAGLTVHVERAHGREGGFGRDISLAKSCIIAGRALWFYPWKFLAPANLMAIYPRAPVDATRMVQFVPALAALAVPAAAWAARRWLGLWPLVAMVSYAALISPVLSFVDFGFLGHSFVADHFFYLPMLPWAALAGAALALAARRAAPEGWHGQSRRAGSGHVTLVISRWVQLRMLGGVSALILVLGLLTWRQASLYRNTEVFWCHNLAGNPSVMAYNTLAEASWSRGDAARTVELARASIELRDNARARYRLATVHNALQRHDDALTEFERALALNRAGERHEDIERTTLFNIGSLHYAKKDYAKAIEYWEAAQKAAPNWPEPDKWLAKLRPR